MDGQLDSLVFSMAKSPGVYAVLLGSGVSRAAGIMEGGESVVAYCHQLATSQGDDCSDEPEEWYVSKFGTEPKYDAIIEHLAPTRHARQDLLKSYFEATSNEQATNRKQPTRTHKAIAQLVQTGHIRVILTTNFDRLMEQALEEISAPYNVVYSPSMIQGMTPLIHSSCTVVKVHGDYKDAMSMRNVGAELSEYDEDTNRLVHQIFDEFGMIVCGWSATWDTALCDAVCLAKSRRYSWYWLQKDTVSDKARLVINHRAANLIEIEDADSIFSSINDRVQALTRYQSVSPKSTELAISLVKRYLANNNYIDLQDYVQSETMKTLEYASNTPTDGPNPAELFDAELERHFTHSEILCATLSTLSAFPSELGTRVIAQSMERLRPTKLRSGKVALLDLEWYPLLLAVYASGIVSVSRRDYSTLRTILIDTKAYDTNGRKYSLVERIYPNYIFENSYSLLGRPTNEYTPADNYVYEKLRPLLQPHLPTDDEYERAYISFEFIATLLRIQLRGHTHIGRLGWSRQSPRYLYHFVEEHKHVEGWNELQPLFGQRHVFSELLQKLDQQLNELSFHRGNFPHLLSGGWDLKDKFTHFQVPGNFGTINPTPDAEKPTRFSGTLTRHRLPSVPFPFDVNIVPSPQV